MSMQESLNASRATLDPQVAMMNKDVDPNARPKGRRKRKVSYLTLNKITHVDYKEVAILKRFMNDRGKILPARQSGNTARQQRMITQAIKRSREMALMPFVVTEITPERIAPRRSYEGGEGGERQYGDRENRPYGANREAAISTAASDVTPE